MNKLKFFIQFLVAFILSTTAWSFTETEHFTNNTPYQVCFTPGENCTKLIVDTINNAKQTVLVQAYSFTSTPIAKALVDAKNRGLDVKIILDKSQVNRNKYSSARYLVNNNIPTWVDYRPAIAHNKIIIVDRNILITGSFNFTKAAQERNSENLLIIFDPQLTRYYVNNWSKRLNASVSIEQYARS